MMVSVVNLSFGAKPSNLFEKSRVSVFVQSEIGDIDLTRGADFRDRFDHVCVVRKVNIGSFPRHISS